MAPDRGLTIWMGLSLVHGGMKGVRMRTVHSEVMTVT
jgi:hypothetical protein